MSMQVAIIKLDFLNFLQALAQIYAKMMEHGVKHSVRQMSQPSAKPKKD